MRTASPTSTCPRRAPRTKPRPPRRPTSPERLNTRTPEHLPHAHMSQDQDITAPFETESLEAGWAAKSSARPRCYAYLVYGAKTDLSRLRENNEDKFDYLEPEEPSVLATKGRVFADADGMGGHSAGQIAAELALNVFIRSYYSDVKPEVEPSLAKAVREANAYVVDVANTIPGRKGMGATLTAAIIRDDDLFLAQVGDSRCYLL